MSENQIVARQVVPSGFSKPRIVCEYCKISFKKRGNFYTHLRRKHQFKVLIQGNQNCAICNDKFRTIARLHEHMQNAHSAPLKFVDKTFYSEKDFLDWKDKIEKESLSSFIQRNNHKTDGGIGHTYYLCHRSGLYKAKQNRVRNCKASGSIKTGSTCPAFMTVTTQTVDGISEIKVHYQSVHMGHELDTRYIRLTKKERENLAACLKLGVSIDRILEDAKKTTRYSFLTRKHLHNIRRDFKLELNFKNFQASDEKHNDAMKNNNIFFENIPEMSSSGIFNENTPDMSNSSSIFDESTPEINSNSILNENTPEMSNSSILNDSTAGMKSSSGMLDENSPEINGFSILSENNPEIYVGNYEEIKIQDKTTTVSSLIQLQNHEITEKIKNKKMKIVSDLKDLLARVEEWNPTCPLPDVDDQIKVMNACFDIAGALNGAFRLNGSLPIFPLEPPNKCTSKRKRSTNAKKVSKKKQQNEIFS